MRTSFLDLSPFLSLSGRAGLFEPGSANGGQEPASVSRGKLGLVDPLLQKR